LRQQTYNLKELEKQLRESEKQLTLERDTLKNELTKAQTTINKSKDRKEFQSLTAEMERLKKNSTGN